MKDCTKIWPANLVSLKMSFKSWELESRKTYWIFCVSFVLFLQATNRECVALSGKQNGLILKADKDQRNWGRATAEQKHRHEVPPKININFLTDAGKTKGALGFVVLAFLLPMFFCWRGYSIHLLLSILYTVYTHDLIHDWHSVFKGDWIYSRCVICGCPHIQWPLQKCFLFSPVVRGKIFERPMLTFPKMFFRMAGDWATQN